MENLTITSGAAATGVVTYWQLAGRTERARLEAAWAQAGLPADALPAKTTPRVALQRALAEFADKDTLVRPSDDPMTFAVLKREKDSRGKPVFVTEWEARLATPDTDDPICARPDGNDVSEDISETVVLAFRRELRTIHHHDISAWLVEWARKCHAVSLRDSGGFYYIPEAHAPTWRAVGDALASASRSKVYEIAAMSGDKAAEAVVDALTREVRTVVETIDEGIGKQGLRALKGRERELSTYEAKIASFESALGVKLDALRGQLTELGGRVTAAVMTAEATGSGLSGLTL